MTHSETTDEIRERRAISTALVEKVETVGWEEVASTAPVTGWPRHPACTPTASLGGYTARVLSSNFESGDVLFDIYRGLPSTTVESGTVPPPGGIVDTKGYCSRALVIYGEVYTP